MGHNTYKASVLLLEGRVERKIRLAGNEFHIRSRLMGDINYKIYLDIKEPAFNNKEETDALYRSYD